MQRAAAFEIETRKRMQVVGVAGAQDGALAVVRDDEREGGFGHRPRMQADAVARRHVTEHPAEPVVGKGGKKIRDDAELRTAEGCGHGVAAEAHGVVVGNGFFVAGGNTVGEDRHVDVALADEQRFHAITRMMESPCYASSGVHSRAMYPGRR